MVSGLDVPVIERRDRLSVTELGALRELEAAVLEADGGRLKLEWGMLEEADRVECILATDAGELAGFAGLYGLGATSVEITGMVHPSKRRRGIGAALLDEALRRCGERGVPRPLLVVPRSSVGGHALARSRGAAHHHAEHALVLERPPGPIGEPRVTWRPARPGEEVLVARLIAQGFGEPATDSAADRFPDDATVVIEHDGVPVGTLRIERRGDDSAIYGFVVAAGSRGRGVGGRALAGVCRELFAEGRRRVRLDVATDNEAALGLYTSTGFVRVATEDYVELAAIAEPPRPTPVTPTPPTPTPPTPAA